MLPWFSVLFLYILLGLPQGVSHMLKDKYKILGSHATQKHSKYSPVFTDSLSGM
jgi:hypothetical protein